jgi:transposase-like protein
MARYSNEFKRKMVEERLIHKKGFVDIEREHGVLRGTLFQWIEKFNKGELYIDKRTFSNNQKEIDEYEFLKKSFALLKEIRSKQQE